MRSMMTSIGCATVACTLLLTSITVSAAPTVISNGDLLFLSGNTLMATNPEGATQAKIELVSSKLGPIDVDGFPEDGKRPIEEVFPGSVSPDGRFSFNPANFNKPVNKNTSQDVAVLVVTDLAAGKVKNTINVPLPGLPSGTNFNFQSDYFPPADQGDLETNLGYNARNYVAVGSPVKGEYPLFLILSAWSCQDRNKYTFERKKQQMYTKYTYNAATGNLKWSGVRQVLTQECAKGKDLLDGEKAYQGRGLGAVGSAGFLIAGNLRLGGPGELAVYKLFGTKLKSVFRKPQSDTDDYFSKLTLLEGDVKSNRVKVAGVTDPYDSPGSRSQIRLFGYSGSKPAKSSMLTGFSFGKYESVTALANSNGALYALTVATSPTSPASNKLTVVKIGPFSLDVAGGKDTPTSIQRVFQLSAEYSGSLAVVGNTLQ